MHLTLSGDLAVAVLILLALAVVAARAAWWPSRKCRRCDGTGARPVRFHPKRKRLCGRCHGYGRHIRLTRRMANRVILARRDAKAITDRMSS